MIKTVFTAALPIGERLVVKKNRIEGRGGRGPRIAIVTGIHGDGLEGQYVAFELAQRLEERITELRGIVDIYPALNPLGMSATEHGVPLFDLDLDHTFPGNKQGNMNEALAAAIVADIKGANACVDIHTPDAYLKQASQVVVEEEYEKRLLPLAKLLNTQLVRVHAPAAPELTTLAHTLNALKTRALVVEMGESLRITEGYGSWLTEGILRLIESLGGWTSSSIWLPAPRLARDSDVISVMSDVQGIFLPKAEQGASVESGQVIGIIVDPLAAKVRAEIVSPAKGLLIALRAQPIVYPGTLVARVLGGAQ